MDAEVSIDWIGQTVEGEPESHDFPNGISLYYDCFAGNKRQLPARNTLATTLINRDIYPPLVVSDDEFEDQSLLGTIVIVGGVYPEMRAVTDEEFAAINAVAQSL